MPFAHQDLVAREELWTSWTLDPALLALLALASAAYALAVSRLWSRVGRGRGVRPPHVLAFSLAVVVMVLALVSPLDALATTLLSAHMAQHLVLMSVAAPLLAYGLPLALFPGTLSSRARSHAQRWRHVLGRTFRRHGVALTSAAFLLQTAVLWLWHVPPLYEAAVVSHTLHAVEHASFLGAGVVFWWAIVGTGGRTLPSGTRIACLFAVALQGAALGLLMTFTSSAWYPVYAAGERLWGVDPLADQQAAGLLMWGFGAVVPVVVAALLIVSWLERGLTKSTARLDVRPGNPIP